MQRRLLEYYSSSNWWWKRGLIWVRSLAMKIWNPAGAAKHVQ
jgi:hypothetical protein